MDVFQCLRTAEGGCDGWRIPYVDGKYLFFSSNRRGSFDIYWVSLDSILKNTPRIPLTTAIQSPDDYFLYQNYPNPFDRSTTIQFDLKKPGTTKLTIYSLAGKKMETVLSEYKEAGKHQFVWEGEGYPKGEYLCELQVSEAKSKKYF